MVTSDRFRTSCCPACAAPTRAPALCAECFEAFALAKRVHPTVTGTLTPPDVYGRDQRGDDVDVWDAWSLLGDVGGRPLKCVTD